MCIHTLSSFLFGPMVVCEVVTRFPAVVHEAGQKIDSVDVCEDCEQYVCRF